MTALYDRLYDFWHFFRASITQGDSPRGAVVFAWSAAAVNREAIAAQNKQLAEYAAMKAAEHEARRMRAVEGIHHEALQIAREAAALETRLANFRRRLADALPAEASSHG